MTDKPKKAQFKPINVATDDWEMYNQFAISMSAAKGERISIPALIKKSVEYYYKSI